MAIKVEEALTVPLPLPEAYPRCLGATEAVPRSKLKRADEAASKVELRTKMSLKSFEEKIELDCSPEGEGGYQGARLEQSRRASDAGRLRKEPGQRELLGELAPGNGGQELEASHRAWIGWRFHGGSLPLRKTDR